MHLIWMTLIGFVAGLIAKVITPGAGPSGFFLTAALGIGGSLTATYLRRSWACTNRANRPVSLEPSSGRPCCCWDITSSPKSKHALLSDEITTDFGRGSLLFQVAAGGNAANAPDRLHQAAQSM